jgi:hypothetical protein
MQRRPPLHCLQVAHQSCEPLRVCPRHARRDMGAVEYPCLQATSQRHDRDHTPPLGQRPSFPGSSRWHHDYASSTSITATSIRGTSPPSPPSTPAHEHRQLRNHFQNQITKKIARRNQVNLRSRHASVKIQLVSCPHLRRNEVREPPFSDRGMAARLRSPGSVAHSDLALARGTRALDPEVRGAAVLDTIRTSRWPAYRLRTRAQSLIHSIGGALGSSIELVTRAHARFSRRSSVVWWGIVGGVSERGRAD